MNEIHSELLAALKLDQSDNWKEAHNIVQRIESKEAYLIHAYLHRKEGDLSNARYWYKRAHANEFKGSPNDEWANLYKIIKSINVVTIQHPFLESAKQPVILAYNASLNFPQASPEAWL